MRDRRKTTLAYFMIFTIIFLIILLIKPVDAVDYEKKGQDIATKFSGLLGIAVNDTIALAQAENISAKIEELAQKKKEIWFNIGSDNAPLEQRKEANLYKTIAIVNSLGMEITKYENGKLVSKEKLKNVSDPSQTEYLTEDYFARTINLSEGKVSVSKVMTWYTPKEEVFDEMSEEDIGKYEKVIARDVMKEGVIRFSSPRYKDGKVDSIVILSLDYRQLQELTKHIDPYTEEPVVSTRYDGNYILVFDNEGNTIVHPKPDNIRGYLKNGSLAGYNEENSDREGRIFNLYKYHKSDSYRKMAETVLEDKETYTASATDVSGRTKLTVSVPIIYDDERTDIGEVFGGIMMSIDLGTEKEEKEKNTSGERSVNINEKEFAEQAIKEKAKSVAKEIDIYLNAHTDKTVEDLQNDEYFKEISVQQVGETGYTAVTDYDSLTCRFHKNPDIVNLDLHTLSEKLPGFWKIMSETEGGRPAEGTYEWVDENNQTRLKYMYIAIVEARTADGVGFSVAATTYLDEYQDFHVKVSEVKKYEFNYLIIIIAIIASLIYLSLISLSKGKKEYPELEKNFKLMVLSGLIHVIIHAIRLHVKTIELATYLERTGFATACLFSFFFVLTAISTANIRLKRSVKIILYLIITSIVIITIFTSLVCKTMIEDPEIMEKYGSLSMQHGVLFPIILGIMITYLIATFLFILYRQAKNKDENIKYFLWVFAASGVLIAIYATALIFIDVKIPYLQMIILPLMALSIGISLLKLKFLTQKRNTILILTAIMVFVLIVIFLLNAVQSSKNLAGSATASFEEQEVWIAKYSGDQIEQFYNDLLRDMESLADNQIVKDMQYVPVYEKFMQLHEKYQGYLDDIYLLDEKGMVIARYPFKEGRIGTDYSEKPGVKEALESGEPKVTSLFTTGSNKKAISLIVPIKENKQTKGVIRVNVYADTVGKRFIDLLDFGTAGHGMLFFNHKTFETKIPQCLDTKCQIKKLNPQQTEKAIQQGELITGMMTKHETLGDDFLGVVRDVKVGNNSWALAVMTKKSEALATIADYLNRAWIFTFSTIIVLIISAIIFGTILTKSLRTEVADKTAELNGYNQRLTSMVDERTQELNIKSAEMVKLNQQLEEQVQKKTQELSSKLEKEEKTTLAMITILERAKRANKELQESKRSLQDAKEQIEVFNKGLEKKVKERTKDLETARDRIQNLLDVKTQFVNQVAHDLRTPLTPIMVLLPIIKKKIKLKEDIEKIDVVLGNANYLSAIVRDTLNIARIDSGTLSFNKRPEDMRDLVDEVLTNNKVVLNNNGVKGVNRVPEGLPLVNIDKLRIMEVYENLVMNATKFMEDSKKKELIFDAEMRDGDVIASVKDTGVGISKDHIGRVFDEFFKIDPSRHEHSSGLGLSICKRIINHHGGIIWAESPGKGKGTSMKFSLPVKSAVKSNQGFAENSKNKDVKENPKDKSQKRTKKTKKIKKTKKRSKKKN